MGEYVGITVDVSIALSDDIQTYQSCVHSIDNLSSNSILKNTSLCLIPETGYYKQNIDVQIVKYQYISKFTCMALIYVFCATLIAKVMDTIIFLYVHLSEKNKNCT